ncbi:hypothetical protein AB6A40_008563 [Gnathostoma spinigerum]|uniref:non-specific serine/threonine protein kinase n=1 Tax=Gnathostoma spinigerum TaxID=75299 RepID=A0ABD6EPF5_9BILA
MFDPELTAMASESYERAYGAMVLVQQLTELEEAIEFKIWPERRPRIAVVWSRRLQGCRQHIEEWQRLLLVRSLVLSMSEMRPTWIKFSSLCRRQGKLKMSKRILTRLLGVPPDSVLSQIQSLPMDKPSLVLATCKQMWNEKQELQACTTLEALVSQMDRDKPKIKQNPESSRLAAKCCLKLGEWHEHLSSTITSHTPLVGAGVTPTPMNPVMLGVANRMVGTTLAGLPTPASVLPSPSALPIPANHSPTMKYYSAATNYDPTWFKAWHKLASAYFNAAMYQPKPEALISPNQAVLAPLPSPISYGQMSSSIASKPQDPSLLSPQSMVVPSPSINVAVAGQNTIFFAVQAVRCFLKAITLAEGSRLEDTLRFLSLWFRHGDHLEVFETIRDSLRALPVEMWLEVIPQLMARLDSKQNVAQLIKQVVIDLSRVHPQSLVYALTVAAKSTNLRRSSIAKEILTIMGECRPTLVEQAKLVSDELIRCAILWHEQWHEALDDASKLYFQEKNIKGMFNLLEPLHEMVDRGATTMKEQSFKQTYDNELKEAWSACRGYARSQNVKELNQAWDLYYSVFRKISQQLRQLTSLDLNYVSPKLMKAQNLELAVPGTYDPNAPLVTIASVGSHLQVISSKQRPRKVVIKGSA